MELIDIWLTDDIAIHSSDTEAGQYIHVALPYYIEVLTGAPYVNPSLIFAARKKFMEDFPGWGVILLAEGGKDEPETWEKYYDELPGRLHKSNPAPDVILLQGTDFERMAREESLLDIRVFLEGDVNFNEERYIPWFFLDNGNPYNRFKIPVSFSIPVFRFSNYVRNIGFVLKPEQQTANETWTWDEMLVFFNDINILAKREVIFSHFSDDLTRYLLMYYHDAFYDYNTGQYNFNIPVFAEILTSVKKAYKDGFTWDIREEGPLSNNYFSYETDVENSIVRFVSGQSNANGFIEIDFMHNDLMDYSTFVLTAGTRYPFPKMGGIDSIALQPAQEFAINAHSPHPEMAWEFIKVMLSEEIQQGYNRYYAPLQMTLDYIPVIAKLDGLGVKHAKTAFRGQSDEQIAWYNTQRRIFYERAGLVYGWGGDPDVLDKIIAYASEFFNDEIMLEDVIIHLGLVES
jgi:hypothetical protein